MSNLTPNRHDRGWPRASILAFITQTEGSWRYCIEPMGYRDTVWQRQGYVELVVFRRVETNPRPDTDHPPLPVGPGDTLEGAA